MMGTNDDAVSPVIGVMLMLVVTIVIAAVIAVFASGTVGDIEESSNVILKLEDYNIDVASGTIQDMTFVHKGGDVITTRDLKIRINYGGDTYSFTVGGGDLSYCTASVTYWVAGEKCKFSDFTLLLITEDSDDYIEMIPFAANTVFEWTIVDSSGQAIAKGSAEV